MKFTFNGYLELIRTLRENGYSIANYKDFHKYDKCVILRHDVDLDLKQAFLLAQTEQQNDIKSTYFVLLTSNFYNIYSYKSKSILKSIQNMGCHRIGLHFDEMAYPEDAGKADKIKLDIQKELDMLSEVLGEKITAFSYHRPTKEILNADIRIEGVDNSYGTLFFKEFKYLSDSRMHWREPVLDIIQNNLHPRLQILTHPFWYDVEEKEMNELLGSFLSRAGMERYHDLDDNFTDLKDIIDWDIAGTR